MYGRHPLIPAALLGTTDTAVPAVNSFLNTRAADIKLAKKHMKEAQERQARSANRTRRDAEFKVGDLVKLSTEHTPLNVGPAYKLKARFAGPFKVQQAVSKTAYRLTLPQDWTIHPVFHISKLLPFHKTNAFPGRPQPRKLPSMKEHQRDSWVYSLGHVLDRREVRNEDGSITVEYLIKWEGYNDTSWEPFKQLNAAAKKFVKNKTW